MLKTYVITVSKNFMVSHSKAGQPTGFKEMIEKGVKLHTIRGNYNYWAKIVRNVNAGKAILSLRQWTGKPYASKQIEFKVLHSLGIQKVDVNIYGSDPVLSIDGITATYSLQKKVIQNDGLAEADFKAWFKKPMAGGCIIHFTSIIY
jgi:hypothetical protein